MRHLVSVMIAAAMLQMVGCDVPQQASGGSKSRILSNVVTDSGDSDWKHLIQNSTLITVGSVDEILYVQDSTKLFEKESSNGIEVSNTNQAMAPLPNLREAVKGIMVRLRVDQIVFNRKDVEIGEAINIYVKGGYAPPIDSNVPVFRAGKKYLVFLSPVEKPEKGRERLVVQSLDLSKKSIDFNYKSAFRITAQSDGCYLITETNGQIIEDVKRALVDPSESQ